MLKKVKKIIFGKESVGSASVGTANAGRQGGGHLQGGGIGGEVLCVCVFRPPPRFQKFDFKKQSFSVDYTL